MPGVLLIVAVVLAGMSPSPGDAFPARDATTFGSVQTILDARQAFSIDCIRQVQAGTSGMFYAMELRKPDGEITMAEYSADFGSQETYLGVGAGGASMTLNLLPYFDGRPPTSFRRTGEAHVKNSVLRVAWAGWSQSIDCTVRANGSLVTPVQEHGSKAQFFMSHDMGRGAGVTVGVGPDAAAGSLLRTDWSNIGYLFAWMLADYGLLRVTDPEQETTKSFAYRPRILVSDATPGIWSFEADAAATGILPLLFVMEMSE